MCLAIPGRVLDWLDREPPFKSASVEFAGVQREVSMECVPEAEIGDYVLVHAGIAITRIDPEEAERVMQALHSLDLEEEEDWTQPDAGQIHQGGADR